MDKVIDYLLVHDITAGEVILNTLLVLFGSVVAYSFWQMHKGNGRYKNFNLVHLVTSNDGFPDGAKCVEIGVFLLMSWGFIVQVTQTKLAEWYVIAYVGAFVTRGAFGAYLRAKGEPADAPGTTVKTEAVTTVKTTEVKPAEEPRVVTP